VKSPRHLVPMLVALTLVGMLSGCSKNTTPTGLDSALDQAPPAIPAQIVGEMDTSTGSATIEWTASSSANAATYQIYRYSPDPARENAYVLIGETDAATTNFSPTVSSLGISYYRLRTTSTTGVQSAWSATIALSLSVGTDPDPGDGIILGLKP
jgi:hypothetical protein